MTRERTVKLQILVDDIELDNRQLALPKRHAERQAAMRELIRRGLKDEGFNSAHLGGASEKYGIVHSPQAK